MRNQVLGIAILQEVVVRLPDEPAVAPLREELQ